MGNSLRICLILATISLAAVPVLRAEEAGAAPKTRYINAETAKQLEAELKAEYDKLAAKRKEEVATFKAEEDAKNKAATAPREITVEFNGKKLEPVQEPRSVDDVEKAKVFCHRTWSLLPEDFKFDLPVEVFVPRVVGSAAEGKIMGKDQVFMVLPFSVHNSLINVDIKDINGKLVEAVAVNSQEGLAEVTARAKKDGNTVESRPAPARLNLRFIMVTNKGRFLPEASGFIAHEAVDYSTFRQRSWTKDLVSFVRQGEVVGEMQPGETRYGVAVFPRFDPETTHIRILIDGLTNEINYKKDIRKVLSLEFVRPGNVYYPGQVKLAFKRRVGDKLMDPKSGYLPKRDHDVHHGFDWVWLWNWNSAASAGIPKRVAGVESPTGDEKFNFWTYKLIIPNRTGQDRKLTVTMVRTIVKVKLNIAGQEREVEVPLVDDGKLNIYKSAFFEQQGIAAGSNRFPEDKTVSSAKDGKVEFTVAFRERDIDFGSVLEEVHNVFDLDLADQRNKADKPRDKVFKGPRQLGPEDVASIRDQLKEKLPAALQEQLPSQVVAEVTADTGLASETRIVIYNTFKPAPLPPSPVLEVDEQ